MAEPDFRLLPSREMQMDWLRVYLQAYKLFTKNSEEVSPRELETLYVQVNKFALVRTNMMAHTHPATHYLHNISQGLTFLCSDSSLKASHFFWGFWALIQAKYSSIDFDFLG